MLYFLRAFLGKLFSRTLLLETFLGQPFSRSLLLEAICGQLFIRALLLESLSRQLFSRVLLLERFWGALFICALSFGLLRGAKHHAVRLILANVIASPVVERTQLVPKVH